MTATRRRTVRLGHVAMAVALVVIVTRGAASTASLGGITAGTLRSSTHPGGASTPAVVGCDNFTGTNNTSIGGRAATVAAQCSNRTWTIHTGTWTIASNAAASSATVGATVTQNIASAHVTTEATVSHLNMATRTAGVVGSHNGTNYVAGNCINGPPDRCELLLVAAGATTTLQSAAATFTTTNTIGLSRSSNTFSLTLNGTVVASATLTAQQATDLGSGTFSGLYGGNSGARWDNFVVTNP